MLSPLDLDIYCNNGTETALHHVVKIREHTITHRLLQSGANPNLVIYAAEKSPESFDSSSSMVQHEQNYFRGSTCLVEACRNRDMGIIGEYNSGRVQNLRESCINVISRDLPFRFASKILSQR